MESRDATASHSILIVGACPLLEGAKEAGSGESRSTRIKSIDTIYSTKRRGQANEYSEQSVSDWLSMNKWCMRSFQAAIVSSSGSPETRDPIAAAQRYRAQRNALYDSLSTLNNRVCVLRTRISPKQKILLPTLTHLFPNYLLKNSPRSAYSFNYIFVLHCIWPRHNGSSSNSVTMRRPRRSDWAKS